MEDIKDLKKWREYYKNQWLKTGRKVYRDKHVELEVQIQAIENPGKSLEQIYAASVSETVSVDKDDSNLKSGVTGDVIPNIKLGPHKILSVEKNNEMLEVVEGLKTLKLPTNNGNCISIDCGDITSEHELKEIVTSYLKKFDEVAVRLANGHRVYKNDGNGGMIMTEEEVFGPDWLEK